MNEPVLLRFRQEANRDGEVTVALTVTTTATGVVRYKQTYATRQDVPTLSTLINVCVERGVPPQNTAM